MTYGSSKSGSVSESSSESSSDYYNPPGISSSSGSDSSNSESEQSSVGNGLNNGDSSEGQNFFVDIFYISPDGKNIEFDLINLFEEDCVITDIIFEDDGGVTSTTGLPINVNSGDAVTIDIISDVDLNGTTVTIINTCNTSFTFVVE